MSNFVLEEIYLNNNVYAKFSPRKLEGVSVGDNLDGLAIHTDGGVVHNFHVGFEGTEHGIIFQQMWGLCYVQQSISKLSKNKK